MIYSSFQNLVFVIISVITLMTLIDDNDNVHSDWPCLARCIYPSEIAVTLPSLFCYVRSYEYIVIALDNGLLPQWSLPSHYRAELSFAPSAKRNQAKLLSVQETILQNFGTCFRRSLIEHIHASGLKIDLIPSHNYFKWKNSPFVPFRACSNQPFQTSPYSTIDFS